MTLAWQVFVKLNISYYKSSTNVLGSLVNLQPVDIINQTNKYRVAHGLSQLNANENLARAAQDKADDMLKEGYWDHFSPSNKSPWDFMLADNYDYHFAGENLAKDYDNTSSLVQAWIDSPPHRANILGKDFQDIGVAVVSGEFKNKPTTLVVQMFGTQFNSSDYAAANQKVDGQRQTSENLGGVIVNSLNKNGLNFKEIISNQFLASKMFALTAFILLIFYLGLQAGKRSIKQQRFHFTKEHWGNLIFILFLGILAFLTKDGNIL